MLIYYELNILSVSRFISMHGVDTSLLPAYSRIQTGGIILFLLQYIGLSHGEILSVNQLMLYCVSVLALIIFFMFLKKKFLMYFTFYLKQLELEKLLGRKWTEDSDVISCTLCQKEFSLIVRKHHCRNCGQIFCNECSSKMAPIASNKKPVRVCDACYELGSK